MLSERVTVTGGAGFIGSHLVDSLMRTSGVSEVQVIDNLSSGSISNLSQWSDDPRLRFIKRDVLDVPDRSVLSGSRSMFHLAANPDVRISSKDPGIHFDQNIRATYNVLEIARKADIDTLAFASTSTVYGEAQVLPTPENYGPLKPISVYGASKLSCEALISAYASTYGFKAAIFRLANIIGPRSGHGIIYDFISKVNSNPEELEILGDGKQNKSYLLVSDCINAILTGLEAAESNVQIFNVGSEDQVDVMKIAEIVSQEMNASGIRYRFNSSIEGGRGWAGDVKTMLLDVSRLKSLGWRAQASSEEAVRITARELAKKRKMLVAA